jgi:DNA-binding NarL/FixJ family response regulator
MAEGPDRPSHSARPRPKRWPNVSLAPLATAFSIDSMVEPTRQPRPTTLTPREKEVLELAALGLTNRQAAERLGITVHAIKFHLATIYRKLDVANRTEAAVRYARVAQP